MPRSIIAAAVDTCMAALLASRFRGVVRNTTGPAAVILTLHRVAMPELDIGGHDVEELARLLRELRRKNVAIVGIEDIATAAAGGTQLPQPCVAFTLDDGYWDQAELTLPLFRQFDAPVSNFLVTGFLDGALWPWDAMVNDCFRRLESSVLKLRIGDTNIQFDTSSGSRKNAARTDFLNLCKSVPDEYRKAAVAALCESVGLDPAAPVPREHRPMSWADARALEKNGVRFGSHSVTHRVFSQLSDTDAATELRVSHGRMTQELQQPLKILAWPIGRSCDFGPRDISMASEAGYSATLSVTSDDVRLAQSGVPAADSAVLLERHGYSDRPNGNLRTVFGLDGDGFGRAWHAWRRAGRIRSRSPFPQTAAADGSGPVADAKTWHARRVTARNPEAVAWQRVRRLIFLCKGNICRSSYAEVRSCQLGMPAISAGLEASPGSPADPDALRNARVRGVVLEDHQSRRIDELPLSASDLVLCMEASQLVSVREFAAEAGTQCGLLGSYSDTAVGMIPDPYGKSDAVFQRTFELIDQALSNIRIERQTVGATR